MPIRVSKAAPAHLVQIIHEHLTHLVDGDSSIDGAVQTQLSNSIRQGSQMYGVRVRQEYSINLMNIPEIQTNATVIISVVAIGNTLLF